MFMLGLGATGSAIAAEERIMTAARSSRPIAIDGQLDEPEWENATPAGEFLQSEPLEGQAATDRTEARILFDAHNLYVGIYCYQDANRIVVSDLKRDFSTDDSDAVGFVIDPYHDHRNGFAFFVSPGSSKQDIQAASDGREVNRDWDGVWEAAGRVQKDGWTAEFVIPFKTLGLSAGREHMAGINFKRKVRHKNESSYWSLVPRRFLLTRVSLGGILAGLENIEGGRNLRVKPFATATAERLRSADADTSKLKGKGGVDFKYRPTDGLTLDLTYNTDFSQVEVDTQQINLTRFSLFFPEKRDFFLDNASIFEFGDVTGERGAGNRSEETKLFYSRRIGLSADGRSLPLLGGARLSGRAGGFVVGLLNIQQKESEGSPSNNFTVLRLRRNLLARSDAGVVIINREGGGSGNYNRSYGVDLNLQFQQRFTINSFLASTQSPGREGKNAHGKVSTKWDNGFWYAQGLAADVGENFNPEAGFVARTGTRNYLAGAGLKPRPRSGYIREFHPHVILRYYTDRQNLTLTKNNRYGLEVSFRDRSRLALSYNPQFERLHAPFLIRRGVTIAPGDYHFNDFRLEYNSDRTQLLSGATRLTEGDFFDGSRTSAFFSGALLVRPHLSSELSYEYNSVDVSSGRFRADLYAARMEYAFNPRMFVDAFIQYNTSTGRILTNARFSLEHRPLSNISIVLTEDRAAGISSAVFRALIFKYTHLLQF